MKSEMLELIKGLMGAYAFGAGFTAATVIVSYNAIVRDQPIPEVYLLAVLGGALLKLIQLNGNKSSP